MLPFSFQRTVMDDIKQALDMAKIQLMSRPDSAFFTTVCFSMRHLWDNTIRTACTDGTSISFNPDFFMELDGEERVFLLLHEAMHVAYLHMDRLKDRDHARWNVAADHVINLMLIARGFRMPKMGLADPQYRGMSTEEVYNLLPKQDESKVDMDLMESDKPSEELRKDIEEILVRASIQSKMADEGIGSIPGEIEIFLEKLLNPKLPWNRILQKYLHSMNKTDYSFRKPNRRFFPKHILPSLWGNSLMDIAIAVDASGSVTTSDFTQFISETHCILRMMKPEKITLIQFDTEIKSVDEVRSISELAKVTFSGKGGTLIRPIFEWAEEHKPQLLLVFTDGGFEFFGLESKINTVWLIHNNQKFTAPFGKIIHYEV